MSDPFAVAGEDGVKITEYKDRLLLVFPEDYRTGITTKFSKEKGDKDMVVATVHVLDGPDAPEQVDGVAIFPGGLIAATKRYAGKNTPVLGRLGQQKSDKGHDAWTLFTPTDEDKATAREYLKGLQEDPFAKA